MNTINVYYVDAALSHDACMNAFADSGIYVLVSVVSPKTAVLRVSLNALGRLQY